MRRRATDEVEAVLAELAARFDRTDPELRRSLLPARRTVELALSDLRVSYHTTLEQGELRPIAVGSLPRPDVRLTLTSADLLAMAAGDLPMGGAYATGRIRVEASMLDLLRLRAVLG